MSWMQKLPQASDAVQFYSVGLSKTVLIVGLGNPGDEYADTRHNVGFYALDAFVGTASEMPDWMAKKDLKCLLSSGQMGQTRVIAIKPTTYMNKSGEAVQAVMSFYKIPLQYVLVVHDELDINFGQIRLRQGGSDAGNNGIKSVTKQVGEEYGRMRIGIGPKEPEQIDSSHFVLQKFNATQQAELPNLAREANAIFSEYVYGGQLPHETRNFII